MAGELTAAIGDVPWGTHICAFYRTKQDLADLLAPYFKTGLENNEFCLWVTSEPLSSADAEEALRESVPDLDDYLRRGQIEILDYREWYTRSGRFDAGAVLQGWAEKEDRAVARGFEGLRLTGNMSWLEKDDWADFTAYEEKVADVIGNRRIKGVCAYSLECCHAPEFVEVISNHAVALVKRQGEWESIRNLGRGRIEAELRETQQRMALVLAGTDEGLWEWDVVGGGITLDDNWRRVLGYGPGEMEFDFDWWQSNVHPDSWPVFEAALKEYLEGQRKYYELEYQMRRKDGEWRWIWARGVCTAYDPTGAPLRMIGTHRDITERRRAKEELRSSEEKYRSLVQALQEGIWVVDAEGTTSFVNERMAEMLGYAVDEMLGEHLFAFMDEKGVEIYERSLARRQNGIREQHEFEFVRKDGSRMTALIATAPIERGDGEYGGAIAGVLDITERKSVEERIAGSLAEKEELLRELHHRVRNNFQVVSSLLDMSALRTDDRRARDLITDARARIHTMALVHSQLCRSERLDRVDMQPHIENLVSYIADVYGRGKLVTPVVEVSGVHLTIARAVPCALVVNELVANAFRHAFRKGEEGAVRIAMHRSATDTVLLSVSDDGSGMPEDVDVSKAESLGLKVVRNMVVKQLRGTIGMRRGRGTEFVVGFPRSEEGNEDV